MDKYITEAGSLQTMGGLELLYDISPDIVTNIFITMKQM